LKAPQKIQAALKKENEGKGKDQGQEQAGSEEMLADLGESLNCPMREKIERNEKNQKPKQSPKKQGKRRSAFEEDVTKLRSPRWKRKGVGSLAG
jgi:hypothetical protein